MTTPRAVVIGIGNQRQAVREQACNQLGNHQTAGKQKHQCQPSAAFFSVARHVWMTCAMLVSMSGCQGFGFLALRKADSTSVLQIVPRV